MTDKLCRISLFSAILACTTGAPSALFADSRVNSSYAGAYNQVLAMQQQQEYVDSVVDTPQIQTASTTATLPVEVEDARLAAKIKNNTSDSVTISDLEKCAMIDIRGVFKWGVPKSGMRQTLQPQCIAVVDLVDYNTNKVLATTTVAAGDAIKCNIDEFPESGYLPALGEVILPADNPPTEKDVEKALNKEQKQKQPEAQPSNPQSSEPNISLTTKDGGSIPPPSNYIKPEDASHALQKNLNAGLKIAAAAIIGVLAGNALSQKESGDSKLLGTGKKQMAGSAIGALAAGGIMAASSYSGKVAGETIKSGAVNATAGMIVGNMAAGMSNTGSVLATAKCTVDKKEHDCVIGHFYKKSKDLPSTQTVNNESKNVAYYTTSTGDSTYYCYADGQSTKCTSFNKPLQNIYLVNSDSKSVLLSSTKPADFGVNNKFETFYIRNNQLENTHQNDNEQAYFKIGTAWESSPAQMAYAVLDNLPSKTFGYKVSDFESSLKKKVTGYYVRYNNTTTVGNRLDQKDGKTINAAEYTFTPAARSSEDGGIIDLSNEARAKATMAGAGAGAALGGFVGYQGAQSEISERLVTALNDYTNSLNNFYCTTGKRFMSFYNGYAEVPSYQNLSGTESQE